MADKTIGSLPQAQSVDDSSLFVCEQQGTAMKTTGAQWKGYAIQAVSQYVAPAQQAAQQAQQAAQQATQAVSQIGTAVEDTQANAQAAQEAKEAAEAAQGKAKDAQDAIENLGVVGETLSPGEQVQVIKTVGEDGVVTLTFRIPQGLKGDTGDTGPTGQTGPQGVSVVSAEIDDSGHLIITLSEGSPLDAGSAVGPQGIQGIQGPQGESVASIQRTSGTGAAGTTDAYTMYSTDGTTIGTFNVYNGMDGLGSGDMLKFVYDTQNKNTDIFQYVDQKIAALKQEILGMNFFVVQEGENV